MTAFFQTHIKESTLILRYFITDSSRLTNLITSTQNHKTNRARIHSNQNFDYGTWSVAVGTATFCVVSHTLAAWKLCEFCLNKLSVQCSGNIVRSGLSLVQWLLVDQMSDLLVLVYLYYLKNHVVKRTVLLRKVCIFDFIKILIYHFYKIIN